jgi:hypothetical protein
MTSVPSSIETQDLSTVSTPTASAVAPSSPLYDYTKTYRVFVWTIMYLSNKDDVIHALRRNYRDVCSAGDVCMNKIIDFLASDDTSAFAAQSLYDTLGELEMYWEICWKYLRNTLKGWLDKGALTPNAYWAS